jgi:septum formation protein
LIISNIILASASPRRKTLLAEAGYKFTVVPSQIDESSFSTQGVSPIDYAKQLALTKAKDVAQNHPDSLVIGADTVVDFDGQIIGKPRDAKDAERITRMLFSKPHKVITGIALVCKSGTGFQPVKTRPPAKDMQGQAGWPCHNRNIQIVEADTTIVYPKKLTDSQIAAHIASGIWRDKSGAYAIKEHGDPFVDHIDGSLSNVMGLPLELFNRILQNIKE